MAVDTRAITNGQRKQNYTAGRTQASQGGDHWVLRAAAVLQHHTASYKCCGSWRGRLAGWSLESCWELGYRYLGS